MQPHAVRTSLFAALMLFACGSEPLSSPEPTASARFELEAGTENGNVFQLRDAVFELTGPTNTSVTSEGIGPWVQVDVAPGTYSILLKDGWSLHHVSGPGEQFDTSQARLLSANPKTVVLPAGQVTNVIFSFALGDYVIGKDEARARIGIEVKEPLCGNGILDPGEECDSAIHYANATCDSKCTGGYRSCTAATDCASGICKHGNCGCAEAADTCNQNCYTAGSSCTGSCTDNAIACTNTCDAGETSCRNACGTASAACWAACWFDPIGCAATCEPPRAICMNQCATDKSNCAAGCSSTYDGCTTGCTGDRTACTNGCTATHESCETGCNRCASCTTAGQCPYLAQ